MKEVISCSRRTDIPAFYYEWLQERLKEGKVELVNPYSKEKYTIDVSPSNVHSIVLWSKNYGNLLTNPGELKNYNLYFQFTINGYSNFLEPDVQPTSEAIKQMEALSKVYSPDQINWRFDPIVISQEGEIFPTIKWEDARLEVFKNLCQKFSSFGVSRCTISYVLLYEKVKARFSKNAFNMKILTDDEKIELTKCFVSIGEEYGIQLYSCTEPLLEHVEGINKGHCIDGGILESLFGERASKGKDAGQRTACGCTKSKDIGDYAQICKHGCLYCYARIS